MTSFYSLVDLVCSDIDLLQTSVLFAKKNGIINTNTLRSTLSSIKLDDNRKWISEISTDKIRSIFHHSKIETYHLTKQQLFIIKVPVVESTVYSLYNCFPLPTLLSNNTYYHIQPFAPYFLIETPKLQYGYLHNLDCCSVLTDNHFLCSINNLHRTGEDSCEVQLLSGRSTNCKFQVSAFLSEVWHQIATNQWLYIIHMKDLLMIQHLNSETTQFPVPPTGNITLPRGTTGYTTHRVLHAGKRNSTTIQGILSTPTVELQTFVIKDATSRKYLIRNRQIRNS